MYLFTSIYLQAVTGPQLQFFDLVASWPGSVHDSRIFDNSRVRVMYEEHRVPGMLLGDMGYACFPFLMTPLADPGPATTPEGRQVKRTRDAQALFVIDCVFWSMWRHKSPWWYRVSKHVSCYLELGRAGWEQTAW